MAALLDSTLEGIDTAIEVRLTGKPDRGTMLFYGTSKMPVDLFGERYLRLASAHYFTTSTSWEHEEQQEGKKVKLTYTRVRTGNTFLRTDYVLSIGAGWDTSLKKTEAPMKPAPAQPVRSADDALAGRMALIETRLLGEAKRATLLYEGAIAGSAELAGRRFLHLHGAKYSTPSGVHWTLKSGEKTSELYAADLLIATDAIISISTDCVVGKAAEELKQSPDGSHLDALLR